MVRSNFDNELKQLHDEIVAMGNFVIKSIKESIEAFKTHNLDLCKEIISKDKIINEMEKSIESKCLWLIAREQPIAVDLRIITTALKIATDIERIGDHAADIAELTLSIKNKNTFSDSIHIPQMAEAAVKMFKGAVKAYVDYDMELAENTMKKDDIVDDYFGIIKDDLAKVFTSQPQNFDNAIDLLLIAKYLERIADHAVNICEWVHFSQTGEHKNTQIF